MGRIVNSERATRNPATKRSAIQQVVLLLEHWKERRLDTVLIHPSGYCSPANSGLLADRLPEGFGMFPIDSDEAVEAVASSFEAGMPYAYPA